MFFKFIRIANLLGAKQSENETKKKCEIKTVDDVISEKHYEIYSYIHIYQHANSNNKNNNNNNK